MNRVKKYFLFTLLACSLSSMQLMPMAHVQKTCTTITQNIKQALGSCWKSYKSFLQPVSRFCKNHKKAFGITACAAIVTPFALAASFDIPWTWKKWLQLGNRYPRIARKCVARFLSGHVNSDLYRASRQGDAQRLRHLLNVGADARYRNILNKTPLHVACNAEVAQELINNGADVTMNDYFQSSSLHSAVANGKADVVRTLLQHGAPVNAQNQLRRTALDEAVNQRNFEVARVLLENNAVCNRAYLDFEHLPITVENLPLIKLLVEHGERHRHDNHVMELRNLLESEAARAHAENREFSLSQNMQQACRINMAKAALNYPHLFEVLMQDDTCDVNADLPSVSNLYQARDWRKTALHIFAERGDINTMNRLIIRGANVNALTFENNVPIFYAIKVGSYDAVKLLLDNGVDVQAGRRLILHFLAALFSETDDYIKMAQLLINIPQFQINVPNIWDGLDGTPLDIVFTRLAEINRVANLFDLQNINSEQYEGLLKHASDERALLYLKDMLIAAGATSVDGTVPELQHSPTRIQQLIMNYAQPRVRALASAQHARLGAESPFFGLPSEITQRVWNVLNGLPIDQALMRNDNGGSNE